MITSKQIHELCVSLICSLMVASSAPAGKVFLAGMELEGLKNAVWTGEPIQLEGQSRSVGKARLLRVDSEAHISKENIGNGPLSSLVQAMLDLPGKIEKYNQSQHSPLFPKLHLAPDDKTELPTKQFDIISTDDATADRINIYPPAEGKALVRILIAHAVKKDNRVEFFVTSPNGELALAATKALQPANADVEIAEENAPIKAKFEERKAFWETKESVIRQKAEASKNSDKVGL